MKDTVLQRSDKKALGWLKRTRKGYEFDIAKRRRDGGEIMKSWRDEWKFTMPGWLR